MNKFLFPLVMSSGLLSGQTLLFQDNFDAPDIDNLDQSDQTGRRSGLVPEIQVRSSKIQHGIVGNQLNFLDDRTGRIRFHDDPDNDVATAGPWHDWAAGTTGAAITSAGGMTIEFDWTAGNIDSENWVSVNVGHSGEEVAEPGFRVNDPETDIGMLFRFDGRTELFDNGANLGAQGSITPTIGTRHITMTYLFDSFADGTTVQLIATIDNVEVYNGAVFTWENNLGVLNFEIGTLENTMIDNVAVSTLPNQNFLIGLEESSFRSGLSQGELVGDLSTSADGNPVVSTFTLVSGDGDADNSKFQINGTRLEVGNFDFTGVNSTDAQVYLVRVQAVGGGTTGERNLRLTLKKDDDLDNLNDVWELRWAPDLTLLSGLAGTENADGDTLSDLEEFQLSLGAYPNIDPTKDDTDGDMLPDGEEVAPTGLRPATDPTNSDTDFDGLSDLVESNSGIFVNATSDSGTNPTLCDTDADFVRDGAEIEGGSDPFDVNSTPGSLSSRVTVTRLTDDASSEISVDKTYTHAISGGTATTINGVDFQELTPDFPATDFTWEAPGRNRNQVLGNNGDWLPFDGDVTGPGLISLFESFTYSGNGDGPGSGQKYTLTNLTPGQNYDLRLYVRAWDTEGSGRPIDLIFTNGDDVIQPYKALPEDRPGIVTGSGNDQAAYFVNFNYTAQGTELVIDAILHPCLAAASGSYHLYGLTNEISSGPAGIQITNSTRTSTGSYVIAFQARGNTAYQVTKSAGLDDGFVPLATPLSVTTDFNGTGQAVIPASEALEPKKFFRIEE